MEPETSWQELAIKMTEDPELWIEKYTGGNKEGFKKFTVFLIWDKWRDALLAWYMAKMEDQNLILGYSDLADFHYIFWLSSPY